MPQFPSLKIYYGNYIELCNGKVLRFNGSKQYYGSIIIPFEPPARSSSTHPIHSLQAHSQMPIYGFAFISKMLPKLCANSAQYDSTIYWMCSMCLYLQLHASALFMDADGIRSVYLKVPAGSPFNRQPISSQMRSKSRHCHWYGSKSIDSISMRKYWKSLEHPSTWLWRLRAVGALCWLNLYTAKLITLRIDWRCLVRISIKESTE